MRASVIGPRWRLASNKEGYETTDSRYLFLWDDIDFDEYRKAAGDAAANDAEQQLFYTLKLTDDVEIRFVSYSTRCTSVVFRATFKSFRARNAPRSSSW